MQFEKERPTEQACGKQAYIRIKRGLGFVLALLGIIILLIPGIAIALIIHFEDHGPVFIYQKRIGMNSEPFRIIKFRSMKCSSPKYIPAVKFADADAFITPFGRLLRKSSIDELPQLINVLKGDMSIIGPRPMIIEDAEVHELRREYGVYRIRPGITGLAQINGRDTISARKKVELDRQYMDNLSLKEDLRIIFHSVSYVLLCKDNDEK